jgi:hypothetical protein
MRTMFLASQEALRTIEQNLLNRSLLARVIRAEGLADDGGRALLGRSVIETSGDSAKVTPQPAATASPSGIGAPQVTFTPLEEGLAGALSGMIKPVIRRGTRLIDIYVTNRDPAMAKRLADAVGREYIRYSIERRAFGSQDQLRYLMEEEERLKKNLQKSEAAVAEYKANTPRCSPARWRSGRDRQPGRSRQHRQPGRPRRRQTSGTQHPAGYRSIRPHAARERTATDRANRREQHRCTACDP